MSMDGILIIQFVQEGFGALRSSPDIPEDLVRYVIQATTAFSLSGKGFKALFQKFIGKGFVAWINHFFATSDTVLQVSGLESTFDLWIAMQNRIRVSWNGDLDVEIPASCFNFLFMPTGVWQARFDAGMQYETFDVHFEKWFVEDFVKDYKMFSLFMEQVKNVSPVNLYDRPHRCTNLMLEAVQSIIHNNYSTAGKMRLLQNSIGNVLVATLEAAVSNEDEAAGLTDLQVKALHDAKRLIDENIPYYPGNKQICRQTYLNHFMLNYGFKRLFGLSPYKYYNAIRMERGKELLRNGESIHSVAADLDFESPQAFGKAFKLAFGLTPSQYRAGFPK